MSDKDKSDPAASGADPIHDPMTGLASGYAPDNHVSADPTGSVPDGAVSEVLNIDTVAGASGDPEAAPTTARPASVETVSAAGADQAASLNPEYALETTAQQLPGALLAKRRKEFRLSVEDVSSRLKISPRQITALESDDFAQLASMSTVRGFIRSYCKLLELDPVPLIAMLASEPNPAFDGMVVRRPLPAPGLRRSSPPPRRRSASKWPSLLVAAAVVSALLLIAYRYEWFSLPSVDFAKVVDALPPLTGGREAPSTEAENEKAGVLSSLGMAVSSASALEIKAREDSWVEVTTVEGERRLISRLMKAGTTELVEVNEPVVLVIGNAAGVDASLRGQTLNLRAVARDNVAKLSLK